MSMGGVPSPSISAPLGAVSAPLGADNPLCVSLLPYMLGLQVFRPEYRCGEEPSLVLCV